MKDERCVRFLQWALPRLRMQCSGFRKVRRQVCKRLDRRLKGLGLADTDEYRRYLAAHPGEWRQLDAMCRITISRFWRDKGVFTVLGEQVLPVLVSQAKERGDGQLRIWSAGCASGEEPYTLSILWRCELESRFPGCAIEIVATDTDSNVIGRARAARYALSSLKDLPERWRDVAFERENGTYRLKHEYRDDVRFLDQDIRQNPPRGRFDLVLCRNLVFTYFDDALQLALLERIIASMYPGAALVIGAHECLPGHAKRLSPWVGGSPIYRKSLVS